MKSLLYTSIETPARLAARRSLFGGGLVPGVKTPGYKMDRAFGSGRTFLRAAPQDVQSGLLRISYQICSILSCPIVSHPHHLRCEPGKDIDEVFLRLHDCMDVFVSHGSFIKACADQGDAVIFQYRLHLVCC